MKIPAAIFSLFWGVAALLLTACDGAAPAQPAVPTVIYSQLAPERVVLAREFPGRVTARRMAEIRPQVGGHPARKAV